MPLAETKNLALSKVPSPLGSTVLKQVEFDAEPVTDNSPPFERKILAVDSKSPVIGALLAVPARGTYTLRSVSAPVVHCPADV